MHSNHKGRGQWRWPVVALASGLTSRCRQGANCTVSMHSQTTLTYQHRMPVRQSTLPAPANSLVRVIHRTKSSRLGLTANLPCRIEANCCTFRDPDRVFARGFPANEVERFLCRIVPDHDPIPRSQFVLASLPPQSVRVGMALSSDGHALVIRRLQNCELPRVNHARISARS